MGKGGKANQQQKKPKEPEPESEEEHEEEVEDLEDEDQVDYFDAEPSDHDQELLERIEQEIEVAEEPLKLTWAAIHQLKQREKELNVKMDEEMRKIQKKYDELKNPILHQIAKAASGHPVEKQIYGQHELTKNINISKNKPAPIPNFWAGALESVGYIQSNEDGEILTKCTLFYCHTERTGDDDNAEQKISVEFTFAENDIIENKQLKAEVSRKGEQFTKTAVTQIKFKQQAPENSSFAEIFNSEIEAKRLYEVCEDLQRAYNNSVFYYFYQGKLDEEHEEHDDQGEDEDEDESEEDIQPIKKKPAKGAKKGDKKDQPVEKPECKNQ